MQGAAKYRQFFLHSEKERLMKWLLPLLIAGLSFTTGYAQDQQNLLQRFREPEANHPAVNHNAWRKLPLDTTKEFLNSELALKNPTPGLHRLPLDNMPCIVPNPEESVAITNLWKGKTQVPFRSRTQPMPNPVRPLLQVRPSRPLLLTPPTK